MLPFLLSLLPPITASHILKNTSSHFEVAKDLTLVASLEAPKVVEGKEEALDPIVLASLFGKVMLPFSIGSSIYSFIRLLLDS